MEDLIKREDEILKEFQEKLNHREFNTLCELLEIIRELTLKENE